MKKKVLTLTFTLVLLIGLVAAMGMSASAADVTCVANGNIYNVNNGDDLRLYLFRAEDGDTIRLSDEIVFQNASGNFEIEPMFMSSKGGDVILDLNGYGLYVNSGNSYLFDMCEVTGVSLHIVNSDPMYEGWIQFISPQAGSSVFYLGSSDNKLYIYEGVSVTMGKASTAVTGSQATYIINASSYGEIGIHGAYLQNLFISGEGLFFNNNSIGMRNSKVYIDGGTEIKTNSSCIDLHNSPYYPDFQIGAAILDGNNAVEVIDDNQYANTTETALKFKDLLQDGYNLYMVGGGSVDNMNNASLLNNNDTEDCHIYKGSYANTCTTHANKKDIFVHAGGHLTQCTDCGYSAGTTLHTQVTVKEATCTQVGYSKAGYDCACGYVTATVIPALGHDFYTVKAKAPTCTESGTTSDYQICTRCKGTFSMGGTAFTGAKWAAIYKKALGHDLVKVEATPAQIGSGDKHDEDGNIAHYKCSRCNERYLDAEGTTEAGVVRRGVDDIKLSASSFTYNGKVQKPTVVVTDYYTKKKLVEGTDYTVKYENSNSKNVGSYSIKLTFKGDYTGSYSNFYGIKPRVPSNITASQTITTITLKWSKVSEADYYRVYKYNSETKKYEFIKSTTATELKITDLKSGTGYKFKVRAVTKAGDLKIFSDFSAEFATATKTKTPSNITASQTITTITLKWSKVSEADYYRVYKYNSKTKKYEYYKSTSSTSLKITDLKSGTDYKYKVRAVTKAGDLKIFSDFSAEFATATRTKTPSITDIYSNTKGKAVVKWNNVSGESGFQLYYASSKDGTYKKVKSYEANKLAGSKTELKSGKKYYFKVRAYKKTASGTVYSSWSSVKSVKIK